MAKRADTKLIDKKAKKVSKKESKEEIGISARDKKDAQTLLNLLEEVIPSSEEVTEPQEIIEKELEIEESAKRDLGLLEEKTNVSGEYPPVEKVRGGESKMEMKTERKSGSESKMAGVESMKSKKERKIKTEKKEKAGKKEKEEKEKKEKIKAIPPQLLGKAAALPMAAGLPGIERAAVAMKPIPRTPSGIPGLDEMLDGGFEEKSIVLVNGDPGSGKTVFGLQFLYNALERGEAVLYISFGEPRELLYPRMRAFGMNFQQYESKNLFFMIQYQPHEVAKLMAEEGGTIHDIVTTYNVKRIVIDPITPYLVQYTTVYDARLALVRLFNVIRKWGATTLLLNEVSSETEKSAASIIAEFHADGIINLIHSRTEDGVQIRGIEIWKMCGINHAQIARPFTFSKKGIIVYPNERLFAAHALHR